MRANSMLLVCTLVCAFCGLAVAQLGLENVPAPNVTLVGITRHEVMECARHWVHEKVPYCQCNSDCCGHCPYCGSTRCDCSGYVSHCWGLSRGYTTFTLPEISHRIEKHELKPGDIMLYQAEHVVFFGGWADKDKSHYHCFQEAGCHVSSPHHAFDSIIPYPMDWNPGDFHPYRYNHIKD